VKKGAHPKKHCSQKKSPCPEKKEKGGEEKKDTWIRRRRGETNRIIGGGKKKARSTQASKKLFSGKAMSCCWGKKKEGKWLEKNVLEREKTDCSESGPPAPKKLFWGVGKKSFGEADRGGKVTNPAL